jgi:signal transduction histidine kinase
MRYFLFLIALFLSTSLHAAFINGNLTPQIPYQLLEAKETINAAQAESQLKNTEWQRGQRTIAYSDSTFWVRMHLDNDSSKHLTRWLDLGAPRLQSVTLFLKKNNQWQQISEAGIDTPRSQHPIQAKQPVFVLEIPAGTEIDVLVRISGKTSMVISPALTSPEAFREGERSETLWLGILFGVFVFIIFFSTLLFIIIKDKASLYHGMSVFFYILSELCMRGYAALYLWPESTVWSVHSLSLFGQIGLIFFFLFIKNYLNTKSDLPKVDLAIRLMLAWQIMAVIIAQTINYQGGTILGLLICLAIAPLFSYIFIQVLKSKIRAMRYFAGGLLIVVFGNATKALELLGVLKSGSYFGHNFMLVVMVFSLFSFFMAIVDRLIQAGKEKDIANNQLIKTLNDQQAYLEQAVETRTLALVNATDAANKANHFKSKLLAYIGHDLRAPLSAIIASSRMILPNEQCQQHAQQIERSARQQLELIDELLRYSRGEIADNRIQLNSTQCAEFFADICSTAELLAQQQQNRFIYLQNGLAPTCAQTDWTRLRQVLQNLISNSAKFTRYGAISLITTWRVFDDHHFELNIVVDDTGLGIHEEDIERIFLPFERAASVTSKEGHGLGLTIAAQMVSSLGGELKVESTPERGCRFYFTLKVQESNIHPANQANEFQFPAMSNREVRTFHSLVCNAEITEIEHWAQQISSRSDEHELFAKQILLLCHQLDLDQLTVLSNELLAQSEAQKICV